MLLVPSHIKISPEADEEVDYEALSYCWSKCTEREPPTPTTSIPYAVYYAEVGRPNNWYEQFQQYLIIQGYKSLYYELGGRAPLGTIVCDGIPFPVGGELYAALKQLRLFHKGKPFKIWIDAMCINQDDITERNEHIKIMDKIYGLARIVRIWLGEDFGKEAAALHALEELSAVFTDLIVKQDLGDNRFVFQHAFHTHENVKAINWEAFTSILSRSWFRRVWVLQEMVNANAASIHIGEFTLEWGFFSRVMTTLRAYALDSNIDESIIEASNLTTMIWLQNESRRPKGGANSLTLLEALGETRAFKSTHAVGKIYELLSFFSEALMDGEVNYSDSVEQSDMRVFQRGIVI
jgi:hypothetical protein